MNERTFTLQDLREYLSIDSDLSPMYSNFKQNVLNIAYRELKEKSDIYFEYEEIKQNRKVEKIKFTIHKKTNEPDVLQAIEEIGAQLSIAPELQGTFVS